jgi:hypothetical protein
MTIDVLIKHTFTNVNQLLLTYFRSMLLMRAVDVRRGQVSGSEGRDDRRVDAGRAAQGEHAVGPTAGERRRNRRFSRTGSAN